jgi:hypothetical protein
MNGSLAIKNSRGSSQFIRTACGGFPPIALAIPCAILNTDEIQPVLPAPVETNTPLEE